MKYYNKFWLGVFAISMLASCAEESKLDFSVEKPESIAQLEYLRDYNVLKSYVDRNVNPSFKLGAGVSVKDFTDKNKAYSLVVSNFDEVTAGWEMKHGAIVRDDGSLNTANVTSLITAAKNAGVSIYGHTLVWHANQNAKYLNKTIAPTIIPGTVSSGGYCMVLKNAAATGNIWDAQTWYKFPSAFTQGVQYKFTCKVKGTSDYNETIFLQSSTSGTQEYPGGFNVTTEWTDVTLTFTPQSAVIDKFTFNFGTFAGKIYVDDVKLTADGSSVNLIPNADFEAGNINGWTGWTPGQYQEISADGEGFSTGGPSSGGYNLNFTNSTAQANNWGAQAWYLFSTPLTQGTQYTFTCMIKGTDAYNESIFLQSSTNGDQGYPGGFNITTEWSEVSLTFTPTFSTINKFTFNFGNFVGTISVDNVKLTADGSSTNLIANGDFEAGNIAGWTSWSGYESLSADGDGYVEGGGGDQIIEKTPEEKKQIITAEMDRWIKGMMDVSKDYVKAWDVVNEPMDDGNPSQLKTGVGKTDIKADEFYWQDYMGKDYAVEAFKLAAQYGNSGDKLFINDYNLEYSIDKCKGLIAYVEYIESQGARVDGIGTQMHISTTTDKNKIVEMFTLLAQTGKLIKISELDLGINNKKTEDCTDADYQAQAEMYKFVVQKYFELIPATQRYGITFWSPLDSPAGSGWRAGEPIGLWNKDYSRKRAFGSVADAFAGK